MKYDCEKSLIIATLRVQNYNKLRIVNIFIRCSSFLKAKLTTITIE